MAVPSAYTPLQIKTGPIGAPHATKTKLGWVVWNLMRDCVGGVYPVNKIELLSIDKSLEESRLEKLVRIATEIDFPERGLDSKRQDSLEDKLFIKKVEQTIQKGKDNHYTIGLPFRTDDVVLPNNRTMVVRRLQSLQRRLLKYTKLHSDYTEFMETLVRKGYAERVNNDSEDIKNRWYIPHHGVYHPHKPKLRVVFDCAAKFQGIALNDVFLPGPNLTNNLLGVLLHFRKNRIALMADLEAMFYQVCVPEKDRDFLRYLWFPGENLQAEAEEYRMRVHLFGASSLPACANSALMQTAEDGRNDKNQEAVEAIKKNFYVDDLLKSVSSPSEGIQLMENLTNLCAEGEFNLTKWSSNDKQVIEAIPKDRRSKDLQNLNVKEEGLPPERALGVNWCPEDDCFCFKPPTGEQPLTKRGLLATLSSLYDPMGLVAPVILPARLILQETIKCVSGWDDLVPDNLLKWWKQWWKNLQLVENIQIPRWLGIDCTDNRQLHVFADTSEKGYVVVIYVRTEADDVQCNILYSRSRVTPLKRQTIPQLELTAATLAVKCVDLVNSGIGC
ncbi:uncharacterized protein LOC117099830 [Anneissia japonica]|uniref:uncharacterized protein LOC117099830 n=1 Tax=Anneissia japonica TaxID=1529436 RepID=UPI001425575B|nr:uncharacterized protein LOC117099830 [Anneissia japonica]